MEDRIEESRRLLVEAQEAQSALVSVPVEAYAFVLSRIEELETDRDEWAQEAHMLSDECKRLRSKLERKDEKIEEEDGQG